MVRGKHTWQGERSRENIYRSRGSSHGTHTWNTRGKGQSGQRSGTTGGGCLPRQSGLGVGQVCGCVVLEPHHVGLQDALHHRIEQLHQGGRQGSSKRGKIGRSDTAIHSSQRHWSGGACQAHASCKHQAPRPATPAPPHPSHACKGRHGAGHLVADGQLDLAALRALAQEADLAPTHGGRRGGAMRARQLGASCGGLAAMRPTMQRRQQAGMSMV